MTALTTPPDLVDVPGPERAPDSPRPRRPRTRRAATANRHWTRLVITPLAWAVVAFDIFVLLWIVLSSLKTTREFALKPFAWPQQLRWDNYAEAWATGNFADGVFFSVAMVLLSGFGTLALAAPAAYALSRFENKWAPRYSVTFALGMAVPLQSIIIPVYIGFDRLHLIDTLWGLVLVHMGTGIPFAVFVLTAFFRNLPPELEEAAALDGAGPLRTFWQIMLPLARSGLITVFMIQAIGNWGEVFFPLILLRDKTTISLAVLSFSQNIQYTGAQYALLLAGIVMVVAPIFLLYIFLGRRVVEGISAGYGK